MGVSRGGWPILRASGLDVRYPHAHALRGVDLSVVQGSFALIGGRSGSGKSTLALALAGLLPDGDRPGGPQILGHASAATATPPDEAVAESGTLVGLVFQNPATQLFNGTVEQEVAFGPRNLGLSGEEIARRVADALHTLGCEHLRSRPVRHLSGGEQQRVAIAANLAMRPPVLILDEPTANVDRQGTAAVVDALVRLQRGRGVTVVVTEHRLEPFLEHADRLIWLEDGRVVADGSPGDVLGSGVANTSDGQGYRGPAPEGGGSADATPGGTRRPRTAMGVSERTDGWQGSGRRRDVLRASASGPLVSLEHVTAGYDGRAVLRGCSLALQEGELGALVGPNGSGKSTLARVLAGLLRPWQGRLVWHGGRRAAGRVGLLHQNPLHQLVCRSVEDEVRFAPRNLAPGSQADREPFLKDLLVRSDLETLRQRPTQALSVGEQQRTALAAALSALPALVILDEPTVGQDRLHLTELMDLVAALSREGLTALLITHDRDLVDRYASRVWRLADGRLREA